MDRPQGGYAKWNKINTNIWFHLGVESKRQNKQNRNRLINTENKVVVARKEGNKRSETGKGD